MTTLYILCKEDGNDSTHLVKAFTSEQEAIDALNAVLEDKNAYDHWIQTVEKDFKL